MRDRLVQCSLADTVRSCLLSGIVVLSGSTLAAAQSTWPAPVVRGAATATPVAPSAVPAPTQPPLSAAAAHDTTTTKTVPASKAGWSRSEIEQAQNACVAALRGLDVVAIGAAPIHDGECGAAAPIELISVGKSPQVTFSPPAIVTCELAAGLHKWITGDLQVLAKKHLGAPLIRIDTMSSYSCRNAYGRRMARLSEHGKANAIDIRAFMTSKAEPTDVLANWGPTEREMASRIAAAKAAAQKLQKIETAQPAPANAPAAAPTVAGARPGVIATPPAAVAESMRPSIRIGIPGGADFPSGTPSAIGLSGGISGGLPPPNRLGGPKPAADTHAAARDETDARMRFLKAAHTSACRIFGTVLGPEANNAHRNHFHVDMAHRSTSSFCQ